MVSEVIELSLSTVLYSTGVQVFHDWLYLDPIENLLHFYHLPPWVPIITPFKYSVYI